MRKRRLTRQIGVMISEETYQTLISITDQLEISISELIRKMPQGQSLVGFHNYLIT
jgi:predicted CopG family antitoxin